MPQILSQFAKNDYAKYPFLKAAARYVREPNLEVEDLTDPQFRDILARAEERLKEAIEKISVTRPYPIKKPDSEIASYVVALIIALATKDSFIQKRYALAEAKQTEKDLNDEENETGEKLAIFAQDFGWKVVLNDDDRVPYEFKMCFVDYLRNTTRLQDKKWKLVNRTLSNGYVYLARNEVAKILSEEVRKNIEQRLNTKDLPKFPPEIMEITERIKSFTKERIGKTEVEGFPEIIVQTAFPPCIDALYQSFSSGRHLSHIGRFTLTSFLITIGMPSESVISLFKGFSDYSERLTRYQVEHIAGEKGSRTRYIPPKCDTLRTHGVCMNPDEICRRIHHPAAYYRIKARNQNLKPSRKE